MSEIASEILLKGFSWNRPAMALALATLLSAPSANAGAEGEGVEAAPSPARRGLFYSPLDPSSWLVNFQSTYIWQRKPAFDALYTGPNSLLPVNETGYTLTATLYLGLRPWAGAEIFFNPEAIQSISVSDLHGLGGLSIGEEQRGGSSVPTLYVARLFLRQTIDLGGGTTSVEAAPNQFAARVAHRRLVLTLGFLSVMDIFDPSSYSHDPRTSFMNWALWTYGASDYAANSCGYTWGLAVEYYDGDWAFRAGRFAQPKESNGLPLDANIVDHYGDVLEVEHDHVILGRAGRLRLDGFHNRANMGAFDDALAYAARVGGAPAVSNVRKVQSKFAVALTLEQAITEDAGLFARFSWNDGRTETYAYTEIDRSFTVGSTVKGRLWHRPEDVVGLAWAIDGISGPHRAYLAAGGLGFFIGDGSLSYGTEQLVEAFYSAEVFKGLWFSVDGQYVAHPAYNIDRGPVKLLAFRFHFEY
jgi:high affinity Mn2+ porin